MKLGFLWIGFSILALPFPALAQNETPTNARDSIRFSYAASDGCPTKDEFAGLVKERGVVIPENETAPRALSVTMNADPAHPEKWRGSLQTKDGTYLGSERTTEGATCADVAHSLAIFTAIALTPSENPQPSTPSTDAASTTNSSPQSQAVSSTQPATSTYVEPKDTYTEPDFENAPTLHRHRFALSGDLLLVSPLLTPSSPLGVGVTGRYYFSERFGLKLDVALMGLDSSKQELEYRVGSNDAVTTYFKPVDEIGGKSMLSAELVVTRAAGTLSEVGFDLRRIPADFFLDAGVGAVWTRPVSLNDSSIRHFSYEPNLAVELGWGLRTFVTRTMAIDLGFGLSLYDAREESSQVATTAAGRSDQSAWFGPSEIQIDFTSRLGFEVFF